MRDLGGIPVAEGVVKRHALYRSASLAKLDDADQPAFADLGIATVYDLRTAAERDGALDRLLDIEEITDDVVDLYLNLGRILRDQGQTEKAIQLHQNLFDLGR